ncbi:hypothetical protein FACS1894186_2300 [Alphaproteobacteria bacterium]|nr:hypothetical protein FACS1894186_2300 [Alphaproteobacteria bacterium]
MSLRKLSITLDGHATSIALEEEFIAYLRGSAALRGVSLAALIAAADHGRDSAHGLAGTLRVWVLADMQERLDKAEAAR